MISASCIFHVGLVNTVQHFNFTWHFVKQHVSQHICHLDGKNTTCTYDDTFKPQNRERQNINQSFIPLDWSSLKFPFLSPCPPTFSSYFDGLSFVLRTHQLLIISFITSHPNNTKTKTKTKAKMPPLHFSSSSVRIPHFLSILPK